MKSTRAELWFASLAVAACLSAGAPARAQVDKVFLRIEGGGPAGVVNAVAFSPDGQRLYAAGFDKVVHVWTVNKAGAFEISPIAYRVPIGPGLDGTINAVAVSPDGKWLAVGGLGLMRGRADFRTVGMVFNSVGALSRDMREDQGTIFVFNVDNQRVVKTLRGNGGAVLTLAFLPARQGKPPLLVSAAEERDEDAEKYTAHLRLWDVSQADPLAEQKIETIDTKAARSTPALAAYHTGPNPKDVAVAVAWADKQVRVWDVAGERVDAAADGMLNETAALLAPGQFLTGSCLSPSREGVVRAWQADAGKSPRQLAEPGFAFSSPRGAAGPYIVPHDLVAFSEKEGGPVDRAVMILAYRQGEVPDLADKYFLVLLDVALNRELGRCELGPAQAHGSRLAVSPDGKHVAVADADRQRVLVYSTADLAAGKGDPKVLRGAGTSFHTVSFRKKGDAPGLFLEEDGGAGMIFDVNGPRLVADDDSWKKDSPDKKGWDIQTQVKNRRLIVTVSGPGFEAKTIEIGEGYAATAGALLPPRKGEPFGPVLALGCLNEFGHPLLSLYDVNSGVLVRKLAGHVAAVRSLAFSGDGRLLASAADDQTVCLWSMTSLGQVLGKAGALPGVAVVDRGKAVEVALTPGGSPLRKGDVIEGVVEGNKFRPLATALDFYTALFDMKPKDNVVLRVRAAGANQANDVTLPVGQGTDERKPLLNLFVTRDGAAAKRDWIAWTSRGQYDSSARSADQYLGWHFNPEKRDDPVDFAGADKYRKDYESPGILKFVVQYANTARAVEEWKKIPPPEMEVRIDGVDPQPTFIGGAPLVRTRILTLQAVVPPEFPLERVTALTWRLDDEKDWRPFEKVTERASSADLCGPPWGRGLHVVAVRMETNGGRRAREQTVAFHYLPAAPRVDFPDAWLAKNFPGLSGADPEMTTKKKDFVLEADVSPAAGVEVRIATRQNEDDPAEDTGPHVTREFHLKEGPNILEVRATNKEAWRQDKDPEGRETTVRRVRVNYYVEHPAPTVALREVLPASDGAVAVPVRTDEPVVVLVPKVRLTGDIVGEEKLKEVKVKRDDGPSLDPEDFESGKSERYTIRKDLTLKPGEQVVTYEARTEKSVVGKANVRLFYRPPTPTVRSVRPADGSDVPEDKVELLVELAPAADPQPFTAEVFVNGRSQAKLALKAADTAFKAMVSLKPESNRILVRLSNEWGAEATRELQLNRLRLPRIVKFASPAKSQQPMLDLEAQVESPPELPPCEAQLNGALYHGDRLKVDFDPKTGLWNVVLCDVVLAEGDNPLTLTVANKDGESREAHGQTKVVFPPPPPPVVRFPDFPRDGEDYTVWAPRPMLAFTATAQAPLKRVQVFGENDDVLFTADLKPNEQKVADQVQVTLRPDGATTFRLVATDQKGGESSRTVTLLLPKAPAYVVIDELRSLNPNGPTFRPLSEHNDDHGRAVFDEVDEGQVQLRGRIVWTNPDDEQFRKPFNVRVYANGFQQIPTETKPPAPGQVECTFTATVLLTRLTDNVIEVDLPGVPRADGQRNACVVHNCKNPAHGRRLHLIMVGIDEKNGQSLKERALKAIGAGDVPGAPGQYQAAAFERVVAHDALVGGVSKGQILAFLETVKLQIQAGTSVEHDSVINDVVLIYYQGQEESTPKGLFLLSDDSGGDADLRRTAVSCDEILGRFSDAPGAQVVMLDARRVAVADADGKDGTEVFKGSRIGFFHTSWSGADAPASRLLGLVQAGWSKASTLGDLAARVDDLRRQLAPQMRFTPTLPEQLAQLDIAGK